MKNVSNCLPDLIETASSSKIQTAVDKADIAMVILNWNQREDTTECLQSLREVEGPRFCVFLVDNGSADGSPDQLESDFPEVFLIRNKENLGYAEGNNIGIRKALEADVKWILLLNNDTSVHPTFLEELYQAAQAHPEAGILGAKVVYYDRPDILWALGGKLQQPFGRIKMFGRGELATLLSNQIEEFDHVPGAVMLVRAVVFKQIGLLDSEFFLNWEDAEFCLRAQKAGWRILGVPQSLVRHKVSRATAGKLATYFGQRNRLLFTSMHLPRWQFLFFVVPFHIARLGALVVTESLRGRSDLVKAAVLGTTDFFRGRLGRGSLSQA